MFEKLNDLIMMTFLNYDTLFVFDIHTSKKFTECPNNSVVRLRVDARGRYDLWE